MDRSALPSTDRSTVWLGDLIEAMEAVAATGEPCHPAIVKTFSHRLELRAGGAAIDITRHQQDGRNARPPAGFSGQPSPRMFIAL